MPLARVQGSMQHHARRLLLLLAAAAVVLLDGCAVYPAPAVADGTVTYPGPPAVIVPAPAYPVLPYTTAPYYGGPPVSLDLWFGRGGGYHGWGRHYYHHHSRDGRGHGHRHGGFHQRGGGRHH